MQLIDGQPVYSATDLVAYLACDQLTVLETAVLAGLAKPPFRRDPELDILAKRGFEHEQRYLQELSAKGKRIATVESDRSIENYPASLIQEAEATCAAMADGADVIYQATFFDGRWLGHADFLLRVDDPARPSSFGPYHYEVADTKLARHVKAAALLQVCFYCDQLARIQGVLPNRMHIVLGGSARQTESFRVRDFMAYYRSTRAQFESFISATGVPVYPLPVAAEPVEYCDVCRWSETCNKQRRAEDHLSLVADISTRQRQALRARDVSTLAQLGRLGLPLVPPLDGTSAVALARIHEQARIQLDGRTSDRPLYELLQIEQKLGLARLPRPSAGDLFLDLEGDPYAFDDGIDYLFGILEPSVTGSDAQPSYHAFWSKDDSDEFSPAGEKRAFEQTIDLIMDRLAADPNLHVYHYAPYEPTAFKRLMGRYATRENEVDALLRGDVLVDLYRVVRQSLRASVESYSIKKLEPLYDFKRTIELRDATSSIVAFETWLQLGEGERPGADHLDGIRLYNQDDVISTWRLRDWLEQLRSGLIGQGTDVPRPELRDPAPSDPLSARLQRVADVEASLTDAVPVDPTERSDEQQARWLLAQLLSFHRREEKSSWWNYFRMMELTNEERIQDPDPLGGLAFDRAIGDVKQSRIYRYCFPDQEYKIRLGDSPLDPVTDTSAGTVVAIDEVCRTIDLSRGKNNEAPHPASLIPFTLVRTDAQQERLLDLGEWVAANGVGSPGLAQAGRDLLLRARPRLKGHPSGEALQTESEDTLRKACRLVLALDESVLAIQGPPGSGKTHTAAHKCCALLAEGRTVGITGNSHKVVTNLLDAVCKEGRKAWGSPARPAQKGEIDEVSKQPEVKRAKSNQAVRDAISSGTANVAAGTAWLWASTEMADSVDVLFIDEAGQFSLANAVAVSSAARSLVLLGDPLQLDQPLQGTHPPGAAASALGHILGDEATMPADRGLFLETTWRLHPNLCSFTSDAFYEDKMEALPTLEHQLVRTGAVPLLAGSGPRLLFSPHSGNTIESPQEAQAIANLVQELIDGSTWRDRLGAERPITWEDVLIVAPYNAQVGAIERLLPRARVGTVDKFQGQEAPISIYSMASSSPEDAPRGMEFLYSRNRLNVATSRARGVALVVCSPDLLRVRARTPEQMRLANALCLFAEASASNLLTSG